MPNLMCYGLNAEDTYADLTITNPIIYRVHEGCGQQGLIAKAFHKKAQHNIPSRMVVIHARVVAHIQDWSPNETPWVSCTFSLPYVMWEANRRMNGGSGNHARLAVSIIDAMHPCMQARSVLGVEALRGRVPMTDGTRTAMNFARAFQEVLVYGEVPKEAVLNTVPWKLFAATFESPQFRYLPSDIPKDNFEYFCSRLREGLHQKDPALLMTSAIMQSIMLLGITSDTTGTGLHTNLQGYRSILYQLSRGIFIWPYLHRSYKEPCSECCEGDSNIDRMFPDLQAILQSAIDNHPGYLFVSRVIVLHERFKELHNIGMRSMNHSGVDTNVVLSWALEHITSLSEVLTDTLTALQSSNGEILDGGSRNIPSEGA
ncbi:hypothetical protein BDW22DRAFT_1360210 [Trametopsis cervina]|nr:hypothetical protein BDW22DRAFT_1360210 [Trametopsis cervina]